MVTRTTLELCSGGPEFKSRQGCFLLYPRQQLTWLPRKLTWDPPADVVVDPTANVTSGCPIGCCHMVAVPQLMIIFVGTRLQATQGGCPHKTPRGVAYEVPEGT
ncbi:hypothetical protein Tco_1291789, partial [Tanacetum coccineum]